MAVTSAVSPEALEVTEDAAAPPEATDDAAEPPEETTDAEAPPEAVSSLPLPRPHKLRKRKKASSVSLGPVVPEFPSLVVPEVTETHVLPVSPVKAKRAVFAFYILAVLRAWKMHSGSF